MLIVQHPHVHNAFFSSVFRADIRNILERPLFSDCDQIVVTCARFSHFLVWTWNPTVFCCLYSVLQFYTIRKIVVETSDIVSFNSLFFLFPAGLRSRSRSRSRKEFLDGVGVGFLTTLGVGFLCPTRMPSWIIFYIALLNWEFLLKWYISFETFVESEIYCCVPWFPLISAAKFHSLYVKKSGAGVGNFGKSESGVGVGYFTSDSATLLASGWCLLLFSTLLSHSVVSITIMLDVRKNNFSVSIID